MKATIVMELPPTTDFEVGERVLVVSGSYAGLWKIKRDWYDSQWGGYLAEKEWTADNSPEARKLQEVFDVYESMEYAFGGGSRRSVWPGPSKLADEVLHLALDIKK